MPKQIIHTHATMFFTAIRDSMSADVSGILSTISGDIIPIRSTEESWMLSASLNFPIICSALKGRLKKIRN